MFASQAAMVISNARRYRDERRARIDLETLISTTLGGRGGLRRQNGELTVSVNRECLRIIDALLAPEEPSENLRRDSDDPACRWSGTQRLAEVSMDQLLRAGEKVRAEEMVFSVPDGRSVTVMLNGNPILSEGRRGGEPHRDDAGHDPSQGG